MPITDYTVLTPRSGLIYTHLSPGQHTPIGPDIVAQVFASGWHTYSPRGLGAAKAIAVREVSR